jgi:hypothetical protein
MRANVFLEYGKRRIRDASLRPLKRAPTGVQAVVSYTPFQGCMTTGCRHPSATGTCSSVPWKGVYGAAAGLSSTKLQVARKARSYK